MRRASTLALAAFLAIGTAIASGCGSDDDDDDDGAGGSGGSPDNTGSVCETADDCFPGVDAGSPPRILEEHEREEPERLRVVRHEDGEQLGEANRLIEQPVPRRRPVPLVEHEVEDRMDAAQAVRKRVVGRDADGDGRGPDLPLRADEPLRHRRLRHEEGARDLTGLEAAYHPQRQRHLGLEGERRVAAGEDERQAFVGDGRVLHVGLLGLERLEPGEQLALTGERAVAADPLDGAVAGGGDDPGAGVGRQPVPPPPLHCDCKRVLNGLLREVEIAERARQDGERAAELLPEDCRYRIYAASSSCIATGRTSIVPWRAVGIRAAQSIASSSVAASMT